MGARSDAVFNTGNLGKVDIAVSADCVFDFRGDLIDQDEIDLQEVEFSAVDDDRVTKWEHFRDPFTNSVAVSSRV